MKIGAKAFKDCESIDTIVIPSNVVEIGPDAFRNCSDLVNVLLPESLDYIQNGTFQGCFSLKSITIPNGVVSIGSWVFAGCDNLEKVILPDSLDPFLMDSHAFDTCSKLQTIEIPANWEMDLNNLPFDKKFIKRRETSKEMNKMHTF